MPSRKQAQVPNISLRFTFLSGYGFNKDARSDLREINDELYIKLLITYNKIQLAAR
jgi:hypothetical protein